MGVYPGSAFRPRSRCCRPPGVKTIDEVNHVIQSDISITQLKDGSAPTILPQERQEGDRDVGLAKASGLPSGRRSQLKQGNCFPSERSDPRYLEQNWVASRAVNAASNSGDNTSPTCLVLLMLSRMSPRIAISTLRYNAHEQSSRFAWSRFLAATGWAVFPLHRAALLILSSAHPCAFVGCSLDLKPGRSSLFGVRVDPRGLSCTPSKNQQDTLHPPPLGPHSDSRP